MSVAFLVTSAMTWPDHPPFIQKGNSAEFSPSTPIVWNASFLVVLWLSHSGEHASENPTARFDSLGPCLLD